MIVFLEDEPCDFFDLQKEFEKSGEELVTFTGTEFCELLSLRTDQLRNSVEAVIFNEVHDENKIARNIFPKLNVPTLVLVSERVLERTKSLLQAGVDDVILKPVHHEELLLRIASIKRRIISTNITDRQERIIVHFDGRDPEYCGDQIRLPRRERKILEFLASINGRRATKSQIFDAVYGIYNEGLDEYVIEPHICKLRKKLKARIGCDPINSMRYLGYKLNLEYVSSTHRVELSKVA